MQAQPISINTIDTICRPVPEYKLIFKDAQKYRYTDSLLKIAEAQIVELQSRIKLLGEKDAELKAMYDGQLENLHQQVNLYKEQVKGFERLVKIERRKRRLAIAGGIAATGVMVYLYIVK